MTWHVPVTARGSRGWSSEDSVREGDALVLEAPPGTVTIEAEAPGFLRAEKTIEIREDRDVTMSLDPAAVIVIRLRIDGEPFDGSGVRAEVSSAGGGWWGGFDGGVARADHLAAGTWSVSIGEVAGCEPAERVEVDVAAGETREVVIDLERKTR